MSAYPIRLYLRREPAKAPVSKRRDVVAYFDKSAIERAAIWPWFYSSKPTKRNRWVIVNCYRYLAVWLPDAKGGAA